MPLHKNLTTTDLHVASYIAASDPGAVGAGILWIDTSTTPATLQKRNAGNTGWDTLQVSSAAPSGSAGGDLAGTYPNPTVGANKVGNTKLATMANKTFKGRHTAGTGDPEDVTATNLTADLDAMVGDTGTGGTKGLVPAPAAGDAAALKFLMADASWAVPAGTGAPTNAKYVTAQAESGLSAEVNLGALTSGLLKHTVAAGVSTPATAVADTDYASVTLATAEFIQVACSDESTALTTGTAKITFRMPFAMTVTGVRGSLTVAQTSGNIFTVDVNEGGTSILSTKLTIDNGEKTSTTAAAPPVISDSALADDAEMTVDIDQVGDGTAKGLKVTLIGTRA